MSESRFPLVPAVPRPLPAPSIDEPPRATARTLEGLEWILVRELEALGARDFRVGRRTVEFTAEPGRERETLYRAVLECRTAIRILEPLGRFQADSPESLYRAMQEIDWTEQLKVSDTLRVDAAIHDTFLTHSLYAAQIVKDAVVDQLRTPSGRRPSVQLRGATLRLALHLVGDVATIFRDAAGRSLHQRGWRMGEVDAPLSEVLAAGILAIAGWWQPGATAGGDGVDAESILDPMCGSGTLAIEAATIAAGMPPGLWRARRKGHGFFRFRDCDKALADRLVAEAEARVHVPRGSFSMSDLDPRAIEAARACAAAAGVADVITIEQKHFEQVRPASPVGLVVTNPPYGERLPLPRAGAMFTRLGDWLVAHCGGWRAAILAADSPAATHLGLRPAHRVALMNGPIACRLLEVEIHSRQITLRPPDEPRGVDPEEPQAEVAPGWPRARTTADQIGDFRRRLAKRFKHLSKWARRQGIEAFRVYDRDIPEIPLVIDWYAGWLHAAEYDRPHERTDIEHEVWLDRMVEAAAAELGVPANQVFLKVRKRQRDGDQYEKVDARRAVLAVKEGGLEFEVNLSDYLDTGLFLDHRQTRALVRDEASGKRFLNLFCYTGSFSVYAAAGGAIETTSVDLSNTYLDWTRTNLSRNGFKDAGRHRVVRDEARAFLEHRARRGEPLFDLVVVDPPTFSRSAKSETPWDVERDHAELLELVAKNLVPGGVVYFSTNFRRFHFAIERLAPLYAIREITNRTIPEDFRNERIHRGWRLVAKPPV
ncbi:MAG: bifunctional 23S rRNA (guanine(2069)-N(7))-methyltransferase RlmK/23S rRNA (guanine(2445)-N(2))-methyltransferase RlmL [Planctomycetia bacterium]|nr:bifunctional 23S rRNA (guanine(2069)-N(7))-methyltransferase RlmK/23S rRNA (guanine(2445)-N(2))-methyltransferase RlmL [Planctomycetia bacterium]